MLVLPNMTMEASNVRKNKENTKCDKSTVTCDVSTAQYKNSTVKCAIFVTWYSKLLTTPFFKGVQ